MYSIKQTFLFICVFTITNGLAFGNDNLNKEKKAIIEFIKNDYSSWLDIQEQQTGTAEYEELTI